MLKLKKEKILVSLIAIVMVALVVGNVYSLATEGNTAGSGVSLTMTGENTANTANKASNNATANTDADVGAEVGATNSSKNNTANKTTNNTTNNTAKNTNSAKNNTNTATSGLPYAGSNTSIIFIVIALVASAVYAYKKVSDYNV